MSVRIMSQVWDAPSTLAGANRFVLMALADHANDEGVCWPGLTRIASKTALTERQVRYSLRQLEEMGYLITEPRTGQTSFYRIVIGGGEHSSGGNTVPGGGNTVPPNH